jgi:hypothetical protein
MHPTHLGPTKAEPNIEKRKSLPASRSLVLNADYRPSTYPLSRTGRGVSNLAILAVPCSCSSAGFERIYPHRPQERDETWMRQS